jgi:hypothetical protein
LRLYVGCAAEVSASRSTLEIACLRFRIDLDVALVLRWTASNSRPLPSPTPLVVKKGLKICDWISAGMPGLLSPIPTTTQPLSRNDPQLTIFAYRVNRVVHEVHSHLIQFASELIYQPGHALVIALHPYAPFQHVVHDVQSFLRLLTIEVQHFSKKDCYASAQPRQLFRGPSNRTGANEAH